MKRLQKSLSDLVAANELIVYGLFTPSIHESYFGAFLMMKYVCNYKLEYPYDRQDEPSMGKVSHIDVATKIFNSISDDNDKRTIKAKFNFINRNRKKADYSSNSLDKIAAEETLTSAQELNTLLQSIYNITI